MSDDECPTCGAPLREPLDDPHDEIAVLRERLDGFGQWVLDLLQELQQAVKKADTEARWAQATVSSITVISIIDEMKRRGMLV